jgi:two-component system, NtrC family, sensor kinase
MKISRKLTLALILGILIVLAGNAGFRVHREIRLFESDSQRDSILIGRMLAGAVARVWPSIGEEQALDVVEDANQRESTVRIRFTWLDAGVGEPDGPEVDPASTGSSHFPGGEILVRATSELEGVSVPALYTYVPIVVPGARTAAIEVRDSLDNERTYVRRTIYQALLTTTILVTLCGGVAMGLGLVLVGKPVALLIEQARSVGRGDLTRRLSLSQKDEIGELAAEMNTMCDLLATATERAAREASDKIAALEQLRHADRLSTVGQLAAGIAHELGTPLNVVMGRAQLIVRDHEPASDTHKNGSIIFDQTKRMTAIIRQLLDFARRRDSKKSPERLYSVAQQTLSMLDSLARKASVALSLRGDEEARGDVDVGQLQQALTNLVVNGIQAMPRGGEVSIEIGKRRVKPPRDHGGTEGEYLYLEVRDEGGGMTPDVEGRAFEPFFTTKPVGEGTGLGLSVTYGIAREHGGWIDVQSSPGAGSCFTIYFPEGSS